MLMIQAVEKAEIGAAVGFLSSFRSIVSTLDLRQPQLYHLLV
ncbi:MAG TPA: hypothetical protein VNM45_08015 [Bacillus sp. (in: firmicutes)]|nr:hypothetical protein [Bacillus sp. (in: firmicutes)]